MHIPAREGCSRVSHHSLYHTHTHTKYTDTHILTYWHTDTQRYFKQDSDSKPYWWVFGQLLHKCERCPFTVCIEQLVRVRVYVCVYRCVTTVKPSVTDEPRLSARNSQGSAGKLSPPSPTPTPPPKNSINKSYYGQHSLNLFLWSAAAGWVAVILILLWSHLKRWPTMRTTGQHVVPCKHEGFTVQCC